MNPNFSKNSQVYRRCLVFSIGGARPRSPAAPVTTDQYEATANYLHLASHSLNPTSDKLPRFETLSTSLLNRNGLKPAVTGPDDRGCGGSLLPRPTVDEVEQRQRPQEKATTPVVKSCWITSSSLEAAINTGRCQLTTRFTGRW